jgi:tRNA uridine 5-carboxymethylaminomethyl modification enzyme
MSCNPAIGGQAKGQLVKEVDALGGMMGVVADLSGIQFKRLNASKGPAVRSSRSQNDKYIYASKAKRVIETTPGITLLQREVEGLIVNNYRVGGIKTKWGETIYASTVILTTGTFLGGLMHTGERKESGGRAGDAASIGLTAELAKLGLRLMRLKTGTPPRLERKSIDFSRFEEQWGDKPPRPFSFRTNQGHFPFVQQVCCWIAYTNTSTHEIISENFSRSPMFTGVIKGLGPRYCPSIEDKVKRFADKDRHQIFLEPEGLETQEIYANGLSTSLPLDVQERFLRSISGLEKVQISRPGYAVEYDCIDPTQLKHSLESKDIAGLFFGGQINGTSGYEEAAAQGLIAGINAAQYVSGRDPLTLSRYDAYIGVLIDDLVTKGADEPYRMFTSRAEARLVLREDNADLRLTDIGRSLGLIGDQDYELFLRKKEEIAKENDNLDKYYFYPTEANNHRFAALNLAPIKDRVSARGLLRRPDVSYNTLITLGYSPVTGSADAIEQVQISVKYEGYVRKEESLQSSLRAHEAMEIPIDYNYGAVPGLSTEVIEKLSKIRPETLGQAQRISGVNPTSVIALLLHLRSSKARSAKAVGAGAYENE